MYTAVRVMSAKEEGRPEWRVKCLSLMTQELLALYRAAAETEG